MMTILDLLQADGITPTKVASTHGGEYASKCPWCGGKDRFRSWPHQDEGGNYWCRKCGRGGNTVRYLMDYRGMTYQNACAFLGHVPSQRRAINRDAAYGQQNLWQPGPA